MCSDLATDRYAQELYGKMKSLDWCCMQHGIAIHTYGHHAHQPEGMWTHATPGGNYEVVHGGIENALLWYKICKLC